MLVKAQAEQCLKRFLHIWISWGWGFEMLIATFGAPCLGVFKIYLSAFSVAFVPANDCLYASHVNPIFLHFFLPVNEWRERVFVVYIIDHYNSVWIFVEVSSDQFIIFVATQVKEIYADGVLFYCKLFYTVVNSNCWYVPLNETTFTIALD